MSLFGARGPTGKKLVSIALAHQGIPYDSTGDRDLDPSDGWSDTDCSGFCSLAIKSLGVWDPNVYPNSRGIQAWCNDANLAVSVDEGIGTAGAILTIDGDGDKGHIVISCGNGMVIGTPAYYGAHQHASGVTPVDHFQWTDAGLIPGVNYGAQSVDPAVVAAVARYLRNIQIQAQRVRGADNVVALIQFRGEEHTFAIGNQGHDLYHWWPAHRDNNPEHWPTGQFADNAAIQWDTDGQTWIELRIPTPSGPVYRRGYNVRSGWGEALLTG